MNSTYENNSMFKDVLSAETDKFHFLYEEDQAGNGRITQKSKIGSGNLTRHYNYSIINEFGAITGTDKIDKKVAELIFARLHNISDGELFIIPMSLLNENHCSEKVSYSGINPNQVVHVLTDTEKSFTSTGHKLLHHWPIFKKYRETGFGSIIRATMTNHQVCSSKCEYCSTIARNKADSISLEEAIKFIDTLHDEQARYNKENFPVYNELYRSLTGSDIKLRGLILSGGGQPNLWPHFTDFVEYLATKEIDLGLITNGFPEKVDDSVYEKFKWIRISITPPQASSFYIDGQFDSQYIPHIIKNNPNIAVGLSYVYGPWTTDGELIKLNSFAEKSGFRYVRLLTDCNLSRDAQLIAHISLSERLRSLGLLDQRGLPLRKIFHQLKYHASNEEIGDVWETGQCYLQSYNVFWDTTGHADQGKSHCYPCDSVTVLAENDSANFISSERRFNADKWGTVYNNEVEKLYTEAVHPFFDPKSICRACLFVRNNKLVKEIMGQDCFPNLTQEIEHVNFP